MKRILLAVLLAAFAIGAHAQGVNRTGTLYASAARTSTQTGIDMTNDVYKCLTVVLDITVVPGGDTITLAIQGKDPVSLKYYTILTGAAEAGTATRTYKVCPGITAAANAAVADMLPRTWRVNVTHSAGTSFTYSVGFNINY